MMWMRIRDSTFSMEQLKRRTKEAIKRWQKIIWNLFIIVVIVVILIVDCDVGGGVSDVLVWWK